MAEEKFLEYKGRPLVRAGKQIYYGSLNDPYVVYLTLKNSNEFKDITLAQEITIQFHSTDHTLTTKDKIIKKKKKNGLFVALDLGATWLERQLKKEA